MQSQRPTVLLLTTREGLGTDVLSAISAEDWQLRWVASIDEAARVLQRRQVSAALIDLDSPGAFAWVDALAQRWPQLAKVGLCKLALAHDDLAAVLDAGEFNACSLHWALRFAIEHARARSRAERDVRAAGLVLAGEVTAAVAHEINNPLMGMLSNLEVVLEAIDEGTVSIEPELASALSDAADGTRRIANIVRDLRHLTKTSDTLEPVRLSAILGGALEMAKARLIDRANVRRVDDIDLPVRASEGRLFQVFLNLLLNAAQAIEPGHQADNEIVVHTRWDGQRVCCTIQDTGCGIASDQLDRIFEPYYTTKAEGTGLGLPLCKRYIEAMGGTITVHSELGKGTRFVVCLQEARYRRVTTTLVPDLGDAGRARILVIDDEALVGRAIRRVLSKQHDVTSVVSAAEALDLLSAGQTYDLVFCDIVMPEMTGFELHTVIAEHWPTIAKTMIFMTGGTVSQADTDFLARVGNARMRKPIGGAALRDLVSEALLRGL